MLPQSTTRLVVATLIAVFGLAIPLNSIAFARPPDDTLVAEPSTIRGANTGFSTSNVSFENDGLTLHGTVLVPSSPAEQSKGSTRHPAVVMVAGSGPRERADYLEEASAFAASGIITLIYDKRTVGYSLTERSYAQLGDDAVAGLRLLQARPDVDPARAGLWGHSEGGWVVTLAAASHPEVGFVIAAGASAVPPAEVQAWSTCRYLVNSGFAERFCGPVGTNLTRFMVGAGIFPEADHDPLPELEQLGVPGLLLFAEFDRSTAPVTSARLAANSLGNSPDATLCVVPGADHEFRRSTNGFEDNDQFANGYLQLAPEWVDALNGGSFECPPSGPAQQVGAPAPLMPLAWYESVPAQATAMAVFLAAFLSYPITALFRRLRGRHPKSPVDRPAGIVSASGIVAASGTVLVLGYVMATGATESLGAVVLGRPAVWLALQLLGLLVVGSAIWTAVAWWRVRGQATVGAQVRWGIVLAGALTFVPWAAWWGMFLL